MFLYSKVRSIDQVKQKTVFLWVTMMEKEHWKYPRILLLPWWFLPCKNEESNLAWSAHNKTNASAIGYNIRPLSRVSPTCPIICSEGWCGQSFLVIQKDINHKRSAQYRLVFRTENPCSMQWRLQDHKNLKLYVWWFYLDCQSIAFTFKCLINNSCNY